MVVKIEAVVNGIVGDHWDVYFSVQSVQGTFKANWKVQPAHGYAKKQQQKSKTEQEQFVDPFSYFFFFLTLIIHLPPAVQQ